MKRKSLYSFIPSSSSSFFNLLSILTLFLFLSETASSVDPHYEACEPRNCGNQSISYPFWMADVQEPYCGYPGFEITCRQDHNPILHIPENDYIVHQILYENQSVRVSPAAFLHFESGCRFLPISNLSVQDNIFTIASNVSYLYLLSNCSSPLPPNLLDYKIRSCSSSGTEREDDLVLAMLENDKNLSYAFEECKREVLAPVELHKGDDGGVGNYKYIDVLRRGFALNWRVSNCSVCQESGGRCGFDLNNSYFKCFCPDGSDFVHCDHMRRRNYVNWILAGTGVATGIVLVVLFFRRCRRDTSSKSVIFWKKENMINQNVEVILKKWGALAPIRYSYSDIKKMTCSFKEKLGQGGYGTVYKGNFKTGNPIAVKVLNKSRGNVEEFINEVTSIGKTSHVNIVTLLGFCLESNKRALVYEFMPNGSLEKFMYNENSPVEGRLLGWETLYQIAIGIARGLEYLHCGCNARILHLDIKPQNILLDEDFYPKISDFGLAKICPRKESIISLSGMRGTIGYIAPEVFSRNFGGVSHKSDVYSYGMMLLDMVVGRENIDVRDRTSEQYFPDWIYRRLELGSDTGQCGIMNGEENEKARKMTIVGLWCIQINPSDRPAVSRVLDMLEGSLESLQIPPRPYFSSPQKTLADMSTDNLALSSSTKF